MREGPFFELIKAWRRKLSNQMISTRLLLILPGPYSGVKDSYAPPSGAYGILDPFRTHREPRSQATGRRTALLRLRTALKIDPVLAGQAGEGQPERA
jgi:hypothetical protein